MWSSQFTSELICYAEILLLDVFSNLIEQKIKGPSSLQRLIKLPITSRLI
ncbi:hypothetical protein EV13_1885 [Prochlorococcus sp. MIT 0702]|nr:hypothetical protein EV13_1885 [Prochlorococcus sp. MIT 0702]KGG29644.1 hypothetical protein EV12_0054 [Prochlorococcus sp. MIT 0701]KGG34355.1 hypothetical protein EV14_1250 [Prochlorococcus sp. MIT 0703]